MCGRGVKHARRRGSRRSRRIRAFGRAAEARSLKELTGSFIASGSATRSVWIASRSSPAV